jgi:beta-glucosidase
VTWQGASGNGDVGTTIFQGMQAVAPNAHFTFSRDASAPMAGSDVGVVVVGETPYAEGNGDVAMTASSSQKMVLSAADGAAVDRVCAAMKCVVLVVSGRPMIITDRIAETNALVASWLPGSEGAGVADVLFGDKPFTGRLPQTWPRALTQEPINVGDATYDPQYPFGWGLRTDAPASRASAAAAALPAGPAKDGLTALAGLSTWDKRDVLVRLTGIARRLDQTTADGWTVDDLVVSIARDYAQSAPITADSSKLTSDAEHELLVGNVAGAVSKLATVAGFVSTEAGGGVSGTVPATLSLTLGAPASFGRFTPGVDDTYTASTTANVPSPAAAATLSVSDPGHLSNGAFSLPEALQVTMTPASWTAPVSNGAVAIGFSQHIGANDALRTGSYSMTLTFTLSTTTP